MPAAQNGWSEATMAILEAWVVAQKKSFTSADFRGYCATISHPEPANPNAWGGLFTNARRANLIVHTGGYTKNMLASCRGRTVAVWVAGTTAKKIAKQKAAHAAKLKLQEKVSASKVAATKVKPAAKGAPKGAPVGKAKPHTKAAAAPSQLSPMMAAMQGIAKVVSDSPVPSAIKALSKVKVKVFKG